MHEAQEWLDQIIEQIPVIKQAMYDDAKTMGTYGKAKRYIRDFKIDFGDSYGGTPEEQVQSAFNTMIEDVAVKLTKEANNVEIKK